VVFTEEMVRLACDKMEGDFLRVMLFLVGKMGIGNQVTMTQREIALALGIQRTRVSEAMNTLHRRGYLSKSDNVYSISCVCAWRGSQKAYYTALKDFQTGGH
jgi:DNA-binding transcriptional regulator GbsR (MarR family)